MIELFISLESAILAELKNAFISIVAILVTKLRCVLQLRFEPKYDGFWLKSGLQNIP